MTELVNTNRLRVSWTNLREHWDAPPFLFSHYKSGDHGKRRLETNISLHIFGRGFHVKTWSDLIFCFKRMIAECLCGERFSARGMVREAQKDSRPLLTP